MTTFQGAGVNLVGDLYPGDQPTVMLLHGGGQTRHSWAKTAQRLSENGHAALALDLRGHGESDWAPNGNYALDAFVADILAIIDTLDEPPILVGASLGGMTSLLLAGEHPDKAAALVLVDIVVRAEPAGVKRILDFMAAHQDGFATLDDAADAIAAYTLHRKRGRNHDGLKKNLRLRGNGRWYWHWDPEFLRIEDESHRRVDPERMERAAASVTIPTLIVRGARSDVVSDEALDHMRSIVPHAEVIDVKAAGHMVAGDDNDVFAERLEDFVSGVTV